MVINSNPCLAYLMRDNSLCLQILTIAHVYGHNDFFKNNFTFTSATDAKETLASFKARADRVRRYAEDPSIGAEAVELFLDAAHALSFSRSRNQAIRRPTREEQRARLIDAARPAQDEFSHLRKREEWKVPDLTREPLEPEEDLLLFIRDHTRDLAAWQRDLLTVVDDESRYFLPQIETKIMNEGWASHWHHRIMTSIDLPQDVMLEFLVRHNQVICPHPGGLNPYHVGFMVWRDIERRFGGEGSKEGQAKMMEVRESDRDPAFLRRFLTHELMRELDLFTWKARGEHLVVDEISDEDHWEGVRTALLRQVGVGSFPAIRIVDANHKGRRGLLLTHEHDGRDLEMTAADKTLGHLRNLWGHDVFLITQVRGKRTMLSSTDNGFDAKLVS
jgi:stage V sporulation protein R